MNRISYQLLIRACVRIPSVYTIVPADWCPVARRTMADAYLAMAVRVLREARRPMTPAQILDHARAQRLVPPWLSGRTQDKTLQARLSEDILHSGNGSRFFRIAPGLYFLRDFIGSEDIPPAWHREYYARRRSKQLKSESVLVISRQHIDHLNLEGFTHSFQPVLDAYRSQFAYYMPRKVAESTHSVKQLVTYVLVTHGVSILCYRRGRFSNAAVSLVGSQSIGFGGHISERDLDLLGPDEIGMHRNACRELTEELRIEGLVADQAITLRRLGVVGAINSDRSAEGTKHIAVVMKYQCKSKAEPVKGELSINGLRWMDLREKVNDIGVFELWSQYILKSIYDGVLTV